MAFRLKEAEKALRLGGGEDDQGRRPGKRNPLELSEKNMKQYIIYRYLRQLDTFL